MKLRFLIVVALVLTLSRSLWGQSEPELVPPPEPVPVDLSEVQRGLESAPRQPNSSSQRTVTSRQSGEQLAYEFGVSYADTDLGIGVRGVIVGSPAEAIGIKPNDTIVAVNGEPIDGGQLQRLDHLDSVDVIRHGQTEHLTAGRGPVDRSAPTDEPRATYANRPAVDPAYAVPRTVVSEPRSYYSVPSYHYGPSPYSYRSVNPYSIGPGVRYQSYSSGPNVSFGIGYGSALVYPGYGGRGYGYGSGNRGVGLGVPGYGGYGGGRYGRGGFYGGPGRGGIGISVRF